MASAAMMFATAFIPSVIAISFAKISFANVGFQPSSERPSITMRRTQREKALQSYSGY